MAIDTGQPTAGELPSRARLLHEWIELHHDELEANWQRARNDEPLHLIAPLQ